MNSLSPKPVPALRRAQMADADPVWQCRQALRGSAAIESSAPSEGYETHVAWFSHAVSDPARLFLIIEHNANWLGYLRFDPLDTLPGHRVSIALVDDARGTGIGGLALMQGCAIAEQAGFAPLYADIADTNSASRQIFAKCGFVPLDSYKSTDGFMRFVRHQRSNSSSPSTR